MSRAQCQLYADGNQRYCCTNKTFKVTDCPMTLKVRGGPFTILTYPTGDTDDGTVVYGVTPAEGTMTVCDAGRYTLDLDCNALHGTEAPPPEEAMVVCWEESCGKDVLHMQILEKLCELTEATGVDIGPLCDKIEALIQIMTDADFEALCEKMLESVTALEAVCVKLEATNASLDALCDKVETLIVDLNAGLTEICDKIELTNEAIESLCGKIDALTALLTAELAAILVCLGVIKTEQEAQGITLNEILICFKEMKDLLTCTPAIPQGVLTTWN